MIFDSFTISAILMATFVIGLVGFFMFKDQRQNNKD